ncbi:MAG: InlB B-repeat-containing protein, partial [Clostridia bacterium]|nr:InlB B-repeat-containing protein [Clostridia bacterium]
AGLMKYVVNGETTTEIIFKNALIEEPTTPTAPTGYKFGGWYLNSSYTTQATFPFRSQGQILYAKFVALDTCTIETVSGTNNYGFYKNSSGYYESLNFGVGSSYALCKATFVANAAKTVTFTVINYAESNYDFGIFSNLNTTLTASYTADSSNVYKSFKGSSSASTQTLTYDIPTGTSYIYIKFRKDSSMDYYNDSLQFTITNGGTITNNLSGTAVNRWRVIDGSESYSFSNTGTEWKTWSSPDNSAYYRSQNVGVASSTAECIIEIVASKGAVLTVRATSYGENGYDYGELSYLNLAMTAFSFQGITGETKTLTYTIPSTGKHFIYATYTKDSSTDEGNDYFELEFGITA